MITAYEYELRPLVAQSLSDNPDGDEELELGDEELEDEEDGGEAEEEEEVLE